jgi:hypothetical protein
MVFFYLLVFFNEALAKQDTTRLIKIEHAEPLYIDLIRDLGARKGEREWNVGLGIQDNINYDEIELLVEYEWAVANRLGLEIEVPVSLYSKNNKASEASQPSHAVEGLKTAMQWTFLVNQKLKTSMAFGYINEVKLTELDDIRSNKLFAGNNFNPFLVVAKRFAGNFHSLIYTGPQFYKPFGSKAWQNSYDINTNFHYMIPSSRNFIGLEFNKTFRNQDFDMMIRPQMRVSIADNLMVGIVSGIPVNRENKRFQSFLRLIYEPGHKH